MVKPSQGQRQDPPEPGEIEVSVFGSGIGESIVIHLGAGEWLIVDSCLESAANRSPVALGYLKRLGVEVASSVKLVAVTHWHQDHMEGAAELMRGAREGRFVCSAALRCQELMTLVEARGPVSSGGGGGIQELYAVLKLVANRGTPRSPLPSRLEWATADRRLYRREESPVGPECEVWSLSPSSASITLAALDFKALLERATDRNRALPSRDPNEYSVVLWVKVGMAQVLLGGDLERSAAPDRGWQAIVLSTGRSQGRAQAFKVPHHGSANADHPDVWERLLGEQAAAVVTPYVRLKSRLPTPADVKRLKARTSHLYTTGDPSRWRPPRRHSAVERTLNETVIDRRVVRGPMGHVRLRWSAVDVDAQPRVDLDGGALGL